MEYATQSRGSARSNTSSLLGRSVGLPSRTVVEERYAVFTGGGELRNHKLPAPRALTPQRQPRTERRDPYADDVRMRRPREYGVGFLQSSDRWVTVPASPRDSRRSGGAQLYEPFPLPTPAPGYCTEYRRAYTTPREHNNFEPHKERTGMGTEAWTRSDGCIFKASPAICRDPSYLRSS